MKTAKHRYYEALDRQSSAERALERNLSSGGDSAQDSDALSDAEARERTDDFHSLDMVYRELGIKAFSAVSNCLDLLGRLGSNESSRSVNARAIEQAVTGPVEKNTVRLLAEIEELKVYVDQWEARLNAIEAGLKRIDRFTIEAFRELEEVKREAAESRISESIGGERGRLAKEEAAKLALEAGFRMRQEGKRLTLASVAREAGLKYGQIVYAFGNKDAFFDELEKEALNGDEPVEGRAV